MVSQHNEEFVKMKLDKDNDISRLRGILEVYQIVSLCLWIVFSKANI